MAKRIMLRAIRQRSCVTGCSCKNTRIKAMVTFLAAGKMAWTFHFCLNSLKISLGLSIVRYDSCSGSLWAEETQRKKTGTASKTNNAAV